MFQRLTLMLLALLLVTTPTFAKAVSFKDVQKEAVTAFPELKTGQFTRHIAEQLLQYAAQQKVAAADATIHQDGARFIKLEETYKKLSAKPSVTTTEATNFQKEVQQLKALAAKYTKKYSPADINILLDREEESISLDQIYSRYITLRNLFNDDYFILQEARLYDNVYGISETKQETLAALHDDFASFYAENANPLFAQLQTVKQAPISLSGHGLLKLSLTHSSFKVFLYAYHIDAAFRATVDELANAEQQLATELEDEINVLTKDLSVAPE